MPKKNHSSASNLILILIVSMGLIFPIFESALNLKIAIADTGNSSIAYWKFDTASGNTLVDTTGNGNDGLINGAIWTTDGKSGNALSFNGTVAQYASLPNTVLNGLTDLTIEFWIKTQNTGQRGIISAANNNSDPNSGRDNEYLKGVLPDSDIIRQLQQLAFS